MADVQFTYADPAFPLPKRALIRTIEVLTGQPRLKRLYLEHRRHAADGESFFSAAVRKLELDVRFDAGQLAKIPATGPCVVVANHPYGVLDGIVIGWLVEKVRRDFVILTNAVLLNAPEAKPFLLPVDFSGSAEALRTNLETRAGALARLAAGGCVIVFPAGAVSTSPDRFGRAPAVDPPWQPFTAQMIQRSECSVVPVFFDGQNSRLFQIASHLNQALRVSLIFKEVRDRIGSELLVAIGDPIDGDRLRANRDRKAMIEALMRLTYGLASQLPPGRSAQRHVRSPPTARAYRSLPPRPRACAPRL
jgi:putative hemolysin